MPRLTAQMEHDLKMNVPTELGKQRRDAVSGNGLRLEIIQKLIDYRDIKESDLEREALLNIINYFIRGGSEGGG